MLGFSKLYASTRWTAVNTESTLPIAVAAVLLVIVSTLLFNRFGKSGVDTRWGATGLPIVVIGCDSGIGAALVHRLNTMGYVVLAGVFHHENLKNVSKLMRQLQHESPAETHLNSDGGANHSSNDTFSSRNSEGLNIADGNRFSANADTQEVSPFVFQIDVRHKASVLEGKAQCEEYLKSKGLHGLYAVINVAGTYRCNLFEIQNDEDEDWLEVFRVNVGGTINVAKAFTPLLRLFNEHQSMQLHPNAGKLPASRFIAIGSILGRIGILGHSIYCATKSAVRTMMDVVHMELRMTGVDTVLIEPGATIGTKLFDIALSKEAVLQQNEYLQQNQELLNAYGPNCNNWLISHFEYWRPLGSSTHCVCSCIIKALSVAHPSRCYTVGYDTYIFRLISCLPVRLGEWIMELLFYRLLSSPLETPMKKLRDVVMFACSRL